MHTDHIDHHQDPGLHDGRAVSPGRNGFLRPLPGLLLYCLAYLAIRLAMGGAIERDEAEIVYLTQDLRLGYGTQPPLYAWLQWLCFEGFGVNRLSLLVLKDAALAASCVGVFHAARRLIGRGGALAASASLALFPQVVWEVLRIQTHSALMTAIAAATLWLYFALLDRPSLGRYLGFGVLCGLGLQAKYNYGVFLAAVLGASLLVREHRAILWNRKVWAALLPALLLLLPHAAWIAQHPALAFGGTVRKLQYGVLVGADQLPYLLRVGKGALRIAWSVISFVALPAGVIGLVCWRRRAASWNGIGIDRVALDRHAPASRFFACFYGVCLLLLVLLACTGEVGSLKGRWLIPLLFFLPLALFVMFPALGTQAIYADLRRAAVFVALALLVLLPLRLWLWPLTGTIMTQHIPYAQLAAAVQRQCPLARTVVTDSLLSAGNLRFVQPGWRSVLLDDAGREGVPLAGPAALVTQADAAPAALGAVGMLYPQRSPGRRADLGLVVGDGSGRRLDFMVVCL